MQAPGEPGLGASPKVLKTSGYLLGPTCSTLRSPREVTTGDRGVKLLFREEESERMRKYAALVLDLIFRVPCWVVDPVLTRTERGGCWVNVAPKRIQNLYYWATEYSPLWTHFPPPPWNSAVFNQLPEEAWDVYFAAEQLFYGAYDRRKPDGENEELVRYRDQVLAYILDREGVPRGPPRSARDPNTEAAV